LSETVLPEQRLSHPYAFGAVLLMELLCHTARLYSVDISTLFIPSNIEGETMGQAVSDYSDHIRQIAQADPLYAHVDDMLEQIMGNGMYMGPLVVSLIVYRRRVSCMHCGNYSQKLKVCSGCVDASFCSTQCAKDGWRLHKSFCKKR